MIGSPAPAYLIRSISLRAFRLESACLAFLCVRKDFFCSAFVVSNNPVV